MTYNKDYADVIDILSNHGTQVFEQIGKELARTEPEIFKRMHVSSMLNHDEKCYTDMLWKVGKIKTIKRYRQDNGVGLKEAKYLIDKLADVVGFDQQEFDKIRLTEIDG